MDSVPDALKKQQHILKKRAVQQLRFHYTYICVYVVKHFKSTDHGPTLNGPFSDMIGLRNYNMLTMEWLGLK